MSAILVYVRFPGTARQALELHGQVIDALQERSWGATDGQVRDRYGLHWLLGFEGPE